MRGVKLLIGLAIAALLVLLAGCSNSDNGITGGATFTVSGTVANVVGAAGESGVTVQLLANGSTVGSPVQTDANGLFTFVGVPTGTYTLLVTRAGVTPLVRTVVGPYVINQDRNDLNVQVLTQADFEAQTGIAPPVDNTTGKLVVVGLTELGDLVSVTVTVAGGAPVGPAAPAELTLTPGTYSVSVAGNGTTVLVPGVQVVGGEITLLSIPFTGVPPATDFTVTGAAVDAYTGAPLTGIVVTLMQNNAPVGNPFTTGADGTYLFENVLPGTDYRLRAEATGYTDTVFGPFAVNLDRRGLLIPVASILDLQANDGVNEPADNTTATLVIFAENGQGGPFNPTVSLNGGAVIVSPTVPVVQENLAPGLFDIAITDSTSTATATLQDVNLQGGQITVVHARTGLNALQQQP
jgi:hypothetical protein